MSCPKSLKEFGRVLKRTLRAHGRDWTSGKCWVLAKVLHLLIGRDKSKLVGVYSDRWIGEGAGHVVLQVGTNCFLDGDGVSTLKQLLSRFDVPAYLGEFDADFERREGSIECPLDELVETRRILKPLFS